MTVAPHSDFRNMVKGGSALGTQVKPRLVKKMIGAKGGQYSRKPIQPQTCGGVLARAAVLALRPVNRRAGHLLVGKSLRIYEMIYPPNDHPMTTQ